MRRSLTDLDESTPPGVGLAGLALGPGLFGHTVINCALAHLRSSVVSVSLLGEPVGSTLLAFFLLSEAPTVFTVGGGAIVLAGIAVTATE